MSKIRSFFAVELKNQNILDEIERYQRKLQKSIGPLKLVNRSLLHVTLRFFGDIDNETAKILYKFVETEINNKYFNPDDKKIGILKGVGDFNKRVFFIKIHGVKELLQEIYEKINEKTRSFPEIKQETKPYTPHLTIARSKTPYTSKFLAFSSLFPPFFGPVSTLDTSGDSIPDGESHAYS